MGNTNDKDDEYGSPYKPSYPYQEPYAHDGYGNPNYIVYKEQYAYQNATGRDEYGNPTYN